MLISNSLLLFHSGNNRAPVLNLNRFLTYIPQKRGNIFLKCTSKNIFCTLLDAEEKKIKTSCSLKVVNYDNEFNERVDLFKRGISLGQFFGNKIVELGYKEVSIYLDSGINKGRKGFIKGLGQKSLTISFIQLARTTPHNGCRPRKMSRKKLRTKHKVYH